MKRNSMVKIDGEKLRSLIKKNHLNATVISEENGYSITWINSAIRRNVASPALLIVLERHGISFDDIKPDDAVETKVESPANSICNMTADDLYRVIYTAVVAALDGTDNRQETVE